MSHRMLPTLRRSAPPTQRILELYQGSGKAATLESMLLLLSLIVLADDDGGASSRRQAGNDDIAAADASGAIVIKRSGMHESPGQKRPRSSS